LTIFVQSILKALVAGITAGKADGKIYPPCRRNVKTRPPLSLCFDFSILL